jgi:beta-phosphoglucomutase-like phosphatase (HAD superfamily)
VQAGRAGGFGWVVGVDRVGAEDSLLANGADIVVSDLRQLPTES